ncbi:hypothetical protein [Macrococcus bovicus]|uniref:hypothetical protein n=1 Tax=Macrococcus bovicus TaxID=69968 RepID=UPI0025A63783|nr:hypothetical protein [Macrococcus bovicus]WJP97298.1 hypothetical protein QSV55_08415 [Macrococcus bovicus]
MTNIDIRPIKIASDYEISQLQTGDRIHLAGYPELPTNINMEKLYWSPSIFLTNIDNKIDGTTVDTVVSMASAITSSGSSGSPIMTKDYKFFGVHFASFKEYEDVYLTGGVLITGYVRKKIINNMR